MKTFKSFEQVLYTVNDQNFEQIALNLFRVQAIHNQVYNDFILQLGVSIDAVDSISQIPFLPISFFKTHNLQAGKWEPETIFTSSGLVQSRHLVKDLTFYLNHTERNFVNFYGQLDRYHVLALLPSYLERKGSSLIAMVDHFIERSESSSSAFYLSETDHLISALTSLQNDNRNILLLGVSFALLDLAESKSTGLGKAIVMETGGMKGRRNELMKEELHSILKENFKVQEIHSEYGMTELMSQAYSSSDGRFRTPPWMKVLIREINDPYSYSMDGRPGGINIIDLANIYSCAFIETEDLGKVSNGNTFEILGRLDNSDVRGCNLLIQ